MPEQSEEEKAAMVNDQVNKMDQLITEGDSVAVLSAAAGIASAFLQPKATTKVAEEGEEAVTKNSEQESRAKVL